MSTDKQRMVSALRATEFEVVDPTILRMVADLLDDPEVEPDHLRDVAIRMLRLTGWEPSLLFHALLRNSVIVDRELELLLRGRRRQLYDHASIPDAEELVSIATQAALTEFAWADDRDARRDGRGWTDVMAEAMYQPVHTIDGARDLDRASIPEAVAAFITSRLAIFDEEESLRSSLERDVAIDAVGDRVREQYERAPFPRWNRLRRRAPRSLADDVMRRLGLQAMPALRETGRVLVAGCGTGQDAIQAAWRYAPAQVTAVDVSARSLAVAARMARLHEASNIHFVHADLISFAGTAEPFDVVECTGVLHHLPDPEAGLRALAAVLRPGGILALALYSTRARAPLAKVREEYAITPDMSDDALRSARDILLEREESLANQPEMYNLAEMRDFLAHAHEDSFTIPRLADMLAANGLTFLGFEALPPAVTAAFGEEAAGQQASLPAWDAFEQRHPQTFARMYRLLARRNGEC